MAKILKTEAKVAKKTKRLKDPEDNPKRRGKDQKSLLQDIQTGEDLGKGVAGEVFDSSTFAPITPAQQAAQQEYLDQLKAGQAGLNTVENQALREAAGREMQARLATQQRQLAIANARGGVRGAAATAGNRDLGREALDQQRQQEQDLLLQNVSIQDARRAQYGQALNQNAQLRAGYDQFNAENRIKEAAARAAARAGGLNLLQGRRGRRESRRRFERSSDIAETAARNAAAGQNSIAETLAGLIGSDTQVGGQEIQPWVPGDNPIHQLGDSYQPDGTLKIQPLSGSYKSKYLK